MKKVSEKYIKLKKYCEKLKLKIQLKSISVRNESNNTKQVPELNKTS